MNNERGYWWEPDPERVEWPGDIGWHTDLERNGPPNVMILCKTVAVGLQTIDALRAVLQALREGKEIVAVWKEPYENQQVIVRPDGSKP